jgi:hypothetical protein
MPMLQSTIGNWKGATGTRLQYAIATVYGRCIEMMGPAAMVRTWSAFSEQAFGENACSLSVKTHAP